MRLANDDSTIRTSNTHRFAEGEEKKEEAPSMDVNHQSVSAETTTSQDPPATLTRAAVQQDTGTNKMTAAAAVSNKKPPSRVFTCFQLGVHLVLFILALALATFYCVSEIHNDYFVPIVERARRTNEDLMCEFTYYDRQCNEVDVTATPEEAADHLWMKPQSPERGVDQMMTHGAVMVPELLSSDTVKQLREFVVHKNAAVRGTTAEFPMSQGKNRISYGIEASEHPIVIRALKEIHDSAPLKDLLEGLVGKNPALTEITAITAAYGCPNQVWHADVKPDGNAMKFGRTYHHSYSLFITLQNTTGAMGATDVCPGTHYCGNPLWEMCEERKVGLHQMRGGQDNVWRAGDAALLNQQVWHRGTKHTDPNASERIIFIVSFLGRPSPSDTRQLARGTYFHMKWNMWGHTWQDLADSAVSMIWPFNVLRCLHIWKPKTREWGYDLITSTALRIANNQLGCEPEDLDAFLTVLTKLGLPEFLDGTIDTENDEAWQIYFRETIPNILDFFVKVNAAVLSVYMVVIITTAFCVRSAGFGLFCRGVTRIFWTHGLVLGLMSYTLYTVNTSPWAVNISSGKTLMRPFPPVESIWRDNPAVSKGLTTLPYRRDVLVGTRLNTRTIGAYSRWMDFHPGNRDFLEYVSHYGGGRLYRSYEQGLPIIFHQMLIVNAIEDIAVKHGKFLQQDFRTGDWRRMTFSEVQEYVRLELVLGRKSLLAALKQEINFMVDDYRFGFLLRGTTLSHISQTTLQHLEKKLFGSMPISASKESRLLSKDFATPKSFLPEIPTLVEDNCERRSSWNEYWTLFPEEEFPDIRLLEEVLFKTQRGRPTPATVIGISEDGKYDIALYDNDKTVHRSVPPSSLSKLSPAMEGVSVHANYFEMGEWFPGRITRVRPSAHVDILFDDGDVEEDVPNDLYTIPASRR